MRFEQRTEKNVQSGHKGDGKKYDGQSLLDEQPLHATPSFFTKLLQTKKVTYVVYKERRNEFNLTNITKSLECIIIFFIYRPFKTKSSKLSAISFIPTIYFYLHL